MRAEFSDRPFEHQFPHFGSCRGLWADNCKNIAKSKTYCNNIVDSTEYCNNIALGNNYCNNIADFTKYCNNIALGNDYCNNIAYLTDYWNNIVHLTDYCNIIAEVSSILQYNCVGLKILQYATINSNGALISDRHKRIFWEIVIPPYWPNNLLPRLRLGRK